MKKHYKGPFFRHVLLAFFIAMMLGEVFTQNIFDTFFVDNSPAVHAIRSQGSEDGVEYESAMAIRSRVGDLEDTATSGFIGTLVFILEIVTLIMLYRWLKPLYLWVSTREKRYKPRAMVVFNNFYQGVFTAWTVYHLLEGLAFLAKYNLMYLLEWYLPFFGIKFVFGLYLIYAYLEPIMFIYISRSVYSEEEIFLKKTARPITIYSKILLMLLFLIVIPFAVIAANLVKDNYVITYYQNYSLTMILFSVLLIIGNLQIIYRSIQKPLDMMGYKMIQLAAGDFDCKSVVYYDDEIGRLKATINVTIDQLKEREELRETFGKYVSIEVARQLIEEGKIDLGGDEIEATILFSDIRNFTAMSEKMSAPQVVEFLNRYFSFVTEPIMENNGVINKFIGDAVMAIFTPAMGSENHVDDALRAVLGMRKKLEEFNESDLMDREIRFGAGLNTGILVAGNIGTERRLEYTVIGDVVNVASRIEGQTKPLNTDILISQRTHDKLSPELKQHHTFTPTAPIQLKGKEKSLTLYKVT